MDKNLKRFNTLLEYSFQPPRQLQEDDEVDVNMDMDMGNGDNEEVGDVNVGMDIDDNSEFGDDMINTPEAPSIEDIGTTTEDEVVIDVDDLVQSQEDNGLKINDTIEKINGLMSMISDMTASINQQNQQIDELEQELKVRNPTPVEKLELRSLDSYPYSVKVDDFWKEKTGEGRYELVDKQEPEEYTITKADIDNANWHNVAKSLSDF